jgi:hypothetical protein
MAQPRRRLVGLWGMESPSGRLRYRRTSNTHPFEMQIQRPSIARTCSPSDRKECRYPR